MQCCLKFILQIAEDIIPQFIYQQSADALLLIYMSFLVESIDLAFINVWSVPLVVFDYIFPFSYYTSRIERIIFKDI